MTVTKSSVRFGLAALVIATAGGCAPEVERLRQSIAHPGPVAYQRDQAIQHDPYPLDDVGPEVVGARPREYLRPLNEVERARLAAPVPAGIQVPPRRVLPSAGPTITSPVWPVAPAPPAVPNAAAAAPMATTGTLAPVLTTPAPAVPIYPTTPVAPVAPMQALPRAPY
jgi:hypothetical protein